MKTAIVTGASGNMGQAVVKKFIDEGYRVIGTVLSDDFAKLDFAANRFEKVVVDLMNEENAQKFATAAIAKYGAIDTAVLTVGGFAKGNIADTRTAAISKQIQLNFETAYNIARPVFMQMMKQGIGRIFLIGSKPGLAAREGKGLVAYSLAKSLIFRLAELMNQEAKGSNVVTSVVVPSTIDTPQNRQSMPDAEFSSWVTPEAVAAAVYFYSSDAAAVLREPVIKVYNNA